MKHSEGFLKHIALKTAILNIAGIGNVYDRFRLTSTNGDRSRRGRQGPALKVHGVMVPFALMWLEEIDGMELWEE